MRRPFLPGAASPEVKISLSALFACPLASTNDTANFKMIETDEKTSTTTHADGFAGENSQVYSKKRQRVHSREFTELLQNHLIEYLPHRHDAHFNAEQFDQMIDGLKDKPNEVIMLMDFGMNYCMCTLTRRRVSFGRTSRPQSSPSSATASLMARSGRRATCPQRRLEA